MHDHLIFNKGAKTIQWEENSLFNNWCWNNWIATDKRMKLDSYLTPYTNIISKWISNLDITAKTIVFLE